ncbi:type III restriction/modification system, res subunit [Campylobacter lanienae NCTC 13004]|uniref:Type III restriction/modification system, res subunit n=1 Tax=Campylobacter lanienae NCTC 13004 TaxID=1031753 RepID=A0A1X9SNQ8_9BACT|nr:DEAD/DEAH box helicase family protein [Campylobacter lanienae]ARQ97913.1 type III restriction/modification system, res subunit [Campylobacter lanienae NCTC 13004]
MGKLYEEIIAEYGKMPLRDMEIPNHIRDNISKELREYQIDAIKYYLANKQTLNKNHLMFNMATGSGKTLVMAALMLDCYKNGYRNFVFFVNSTAILEKTKANFCDIFSSKYLFANEINIDGKRVEIRAISNFGESDENAINIYFSTIQGLFSLFKDEKENSLTLKDLQNYEIVFLADEAHHLNSETKNKLNSSEQDNKDGWESIINKAFNSHANNLMLEFSATIPNDRKVLAKYEDKIVYEYALREFCLDGYSKRIFLVKYDNTELKARLLGACLLSAYRELLARENNIELKPIVLFKSESINLSKENQKLFNETLQELNSDDISEFYNNVGKDDELFKYSLEFFKNKFGKSYTNILENHIKESFKEIYQINANDEKEIKDYQIKLNTLEDKDNTIRAIFAVDKLNEGWDVLNLFDIVRLGSAVVKNSSKTTTKEAQLIGRGARYYPFGKGEERYKRKYDDKQFSELTMLERLSYHALNDVEYIQKIRNELKEQGLMDKDKGITELKPSQKAKEITDKNEIFYVSNEKIFLDKISLFNKENFETVLESIKIPYIGHKISNNEEKFDLVEEINTSSQKYFKIGDKIEYKIFAKAMNILQIDINKLKIYDESLKSKVEFYSDIIAPLNLVFNKNQDFTDPKIRLEIAKYILNCYKDELNTESKNFEITEFKAQKLASIGSRKIVKNVEYNENNEPIFKNIENSPYEWLYYDKFSTDSNLEREFLDFIEANKERIDRNFSEWIIMRNEGFEEFKIYDNRVSEPTYGEGFEPDFIFFGKPKEHTSTDHLSTQIIIESKGDVYYQKDKWKEDFILNEGILNKKVFKATKDFDGQIGLKVYALPFFLDENKDKDKNKEFKRQFDEFFKI